MIQWDINEIYLLVNQHGYPKWPLKSLIYLLKMVMFHSYVGLAESSYGQAPAKKHRKSTNWMSHSCQSYVSLLEGTS